MRSEITFLQSNSTVACNSDYESFKVIVCFRKDHDVYFANEAIFLEIEGKNVDRSCKVTIPLHELLSGIESAMCQVSHKSMLSQLESIAQRDFARPKIYRKRQHFARTVRSDISESWKRIEETARNIFIKIEELARSGG